MKLTAYLALLCATIVSAGIFGGSSDQKPLSEIKSIDVPGDNPLVHCHEPDHDIVKIKRLDLDPNPPKPGEVLHINATGYVEETIEDGAYVEILVKVGSIPLLRRVEDICQQIESVGKHCPLEPGEINVEKDVTIPKEVPPAIFTVTANAYTKDKEALTCLTGAVDFRQPK